MDLDKIRSTLYRLIDEGRDGFTLDKKGDEYTPNKGYAVAVKQVVGDLDNVTELDDKYLGYWFDKENKIHHVSVVSIFDSSLVAFAHAMTLRQKAIYDFSTDQVIDLRSFYQDENEIQHDS